MGHLFFDCPAIPCISSAVLSHQSGCRSGDDASRDSCGWGFVGVDMVRSRFDFDGGVAERTGHSVDRIVVDVVLHAALFRHHRLDVGAVVHALGDSSVPWCGTSTRSVAFHGLDRVGRDDLAFDSSHSTPTFMASVEGVAKQLDGPRWIWYGALVQQMHSNHGRQRGAKPWLGGSRMGVPPWLRLPK